MRFSEVLVSYLCASAKVVIDKATYVDPHNYSEGIVYVIVNGEVVNEECGQKEVLAGRVLKRK